jgi:DNA-binding transcriptional MerR regulator
MVNGLSVEQLAARCHVTVRNIRAYQTAGLLPAPERRGRSSFYGDDHVGRLQAIRDLRRRGFGLEAARRVLAQSGDGARVPVLARALVQGFFVDEKPVVLTPKQLAGKWGDQVTADVVRRTLELSLYRRLADGRFEVLSPALEEVGRQMAEMGIPLDDVLDALEALWHHSRAIASVYVKLVQRHVARSGTQNASAVLAGLKPLLTGSMSAAFPIALQQELEASLHRSSKKRRRSKRS